MAWVKGQSGNPGGRLPRPWSAKLREVLDEIDPETCKRKLDLVVERMVTAAIGGDMGACREIADRLEGRPAQMLTHENADGSPISIVIATAIPQGEEHADAPTQH